MNRIGIIPFDVRGAAVRLLFVSSRTRGRWIFPKGLVKTGENHAEACHREGYEEAGVRGHLLEKYPTTMAIGRQTERRDRRGSGRLLSLCRRGIG